MMTKPWKQISIGIILLACLGLQSCIGPGNGEKSASKPNIIYILADAGDPPTYLFYHSEPAMGQEQEDPTHSSNFGVGLKRRLDELGIECELVYPGAPDLRHRKPESYLISKLK